MIKSAGMVEFVFLGGRRIMDDFTSLAELSDDERDKACQKYQIIEPYINEELLLKTIAALLRNPLKCFLSQNSCGSTALRPSQ